jgi:signal transduction histidine kinase/CheY-like chemotaxis protein/CHASE3 domain sensor protein
LTKSQTASAEFKQTLNRNLIFPLAMSAVLIAIFLYVVFDMNRSSDMVSDQDKVLEAQSEILKEIVDSETGLRGYLITGSERYLQPYEKAKQQVIPRMQELEQIFRDRPIQFARLSSVRRLFEDWMRFCENTIEGRRKLGASFKLGPDVTADSYLRKDLMDSIRGRFEEMRSESLHRRDEFADIASTRARAIAAAAVIFTILLGGALAFFGRKQLLGLSRTYEESLLAQARQNEELSRQAWVRSGQARLAELLRGELSIQETGQRMLTYIAEYTGAVLGAVFVNDGSDTLLRAAQHAYPETGSTNRHIRYGEGLVGQSVRDQRLIHLKDIPADYVKVSSTLGDTKPRELIIAPLSADGVAQGAVELAFFETPPPSVLQFLSEVAELGGSAVRAVAYRERLQHLLSESQQLSEELQSQQEELRVSNEELEERSRVLQETQARLESQHAELEQTNEQLEEQTSMLEEQKRSLAERNADLRRSQTELAHKAAEVESASRYKSEFLANMSHELRTPLNSSLILAKLLKDNPQGNLSGEQVEFASTIHAAGNDLLALINDILDLAKVESGKLELQAEETSMEQFLDGIDKIFKPLAQEKGLQFVIKTDSNAPETIMTDRRRAEQVLKNLISNAIKFTSIGKVEVTLALGGRGVEFRVKDSGIGIAPAQQNVIFEAFRQADGTTSRKYGGTGLGLSISKNLAELLGGTITVKSESGKGSIFTLTLPLEWAPANDVSSAPVSIAQSYQPSRKPVPKEEHRPPEHPIPVVNRGAHLKDDRDQWTPGQSKALLVVEDEIEYAKIIYQIAKERGFTCAVAHDTNEGFKLAKSHRPSAILLDIRLPDGSGLSLLDRLKLDPDTRHIPVHGMSVADYSREALHMGAAGFALKASDLDEIRHTIQLLEEKSQTRSRKVLLVEDDETQRAAVEKLIGAKGVEIFAVGRGEEALAALHSNIFDCMIIDLKLPDMTGFDLLQKMGKHTGSAIPPVIVYTGKDLSRAEEQALYRHSRTIIIKGARSPERLLDEVTLFLHQAEADMTPEHQQMLRASRNREKAFEGRTILLVDDDVRNIFALSSALELKGAKINIARNGREAVDQVDANSEIDLVLMDVMMPEMDGLEATRRIRASKANPSVPIIAVTAKAMQDDYARCLQAGANDYLAKPVDVDKLVSLIRVWLPKQRASR